MAIRNLRIKNKRAVFFTLIAVLMVSLFVLAYKSTSTETTVNKVPIVQERIQTANNLLNSMHNVYINEMMEVSLKNAFYGYYDYIMIHGKDINEDIMKKHVISLMTTGYIAGDSTLYNPYNLTYLMDKVVYNVNESMIMNMTYEYDAADISIYQDYETGPWFVGVNASFDLFLDAYAANWTTSKDYSTYIYINNLTDPYHSFNTKNASGDYIERKIKPSSQLYWNYNTFTSFVKNKQYYPNNNSPSFFGRLINSSLGSDCCGIETYISEDNLYKRGGTLGGYLNQSFSDVCYFNEITTGDFCGGYKMIIEGLTTDFNDPGNYDYPFTISASQAAYYNITADESWVGFRELY